MLSRSRDVAHDTTTVSKMSHRVLSVVCMLTLCHARPFLVCPKSANSSNPGCPGESLRETRTGCPGNLDDPELDECEAMWEMIAGSSHGRRGAHSAELCLRMSGSAPRRVQSTCRPRRLSGARDGDPRPSAPNPGHLTLAGLRTRS